MSSEQYVSTQVLGLKEIGEALQELPKRVERNVLRGTVAAGAALVRDAAREIAPTFHGSVADGHPPPGTLKRSIIIKQIPEKSGPTQQMFYVAVRHGKKYQKQGKKGNLSQDAYYWSWVEFGHWVNTTGKALGGRGKDAQRAKAVAAGHKTFVRAEPFMRPAFEITKNASIEAMKAYLEQRLPAEVEKLPKLRVLWDK